MGLLGELLRPSPCIFYAFGQLLDGLTQLSSQATVRRETEMLSPCNAIICAQKHQLLEALKAAEVGRWGQKQLPKELGGPHGGSL